MAHFRNKKHPDGKLPNINEFELSRTRNIPHQKDTIVLRMLRMY